MSLYGIPNTALFVRSLTVDSKSWHNYLIRLMMLIFIGFSLIKYLFRVMTATVLTAPGLEFFTSITFLNLVFITILGVTLFSSVITEEKEVDSLYLLLMTGLTPFTLLISKSTSKLLVGIMLIISQLPFSIMAVTLGGVSMTQVFAVYAALLSYTLLLANLSLFYSVISDRTFKVAIYTILTLVLFFIGSVISPGLSQLSPFHQVGIILTTGFSGPACSVQVGVSIIISILLFIISSLLFNYFTRTNTDFRVWRLPGSMNNAKLRIFPVSRAWRYPLAWKEFFFSTGGLPGILFTGSVLLLIITGGFLIEQYFNVFIWRDFATLIIILSAVLLFLQLLYISSTIFRKEIDGKTFSTIMVLPKTISGIAMEKLAGTAVSLIPAFITLCSGIIILTVTIHLPPLHVLLKVSVMIISVVIQCMLYFFLTAYYSLRLKYTGFILAAVVYSIIYIAFGIPSMLFSIAPSLIVGAAINADGTIFFLFTSLISLAFYLFAIVFTSRQILRRLNSIAAEY